MNQSYKKRLINDWLNGVSVKELSEKYNRTIFKVNLIIEKYKENENGTKNSR